ncbi:MAG: dTDP-4-dehydrorhamnose reductase [Balneolaceae bacterium]|nr:dTDP-4-dehydrorhamnose reductase [Balneolaceae bacterium]
MHFFITGAGGQLGSEWVRFLDKQAENEVNTFLSSELDITDKEKLQSIVQGLHPDVVINCAAYTQVDKAEKERDKAFEINGQAVGHLAAVCASEQIKLVHYSTDYVFPGKLKDAKALPQGYPEDHKVNPVNTYGESKLLGEKELQSSGCSYLLIRTSWLCGRDGHNFVDTMLRLGEQKRKLRVVNDQWGSPAFCENVVENTYHLLKQNEEGIFHISSQGKTTWYEFAQEIFKQRNMNIVVEPVSSSEYKTRAKRPAFSLLNTQKITDTPGSVIINWKDGLRNLLKHI